MRRSDVYITAVIAGLLFAALGLSRIVSVTPHGDGHSHVHVHHHGGSAHHHVHTHHHQADRHDSEESNQPESAGCPDENSDDHSSCCHFHHHGEQPNDAAIPARERESMPVPAAVRATHESDRSWNGLREHRQRWPYPRGRPPDHLIYLRTVVLLT